MELVYYFVGVKPVPEPSARIGRRILWGMLIFYGCFAVPMVVFYGAAIVMKITTGSVNLSFGLFPIYNKLLSLMTELSWKHPYLFALPGAAYRLFRRKREGERNSG